MTFICFQFLELFNLLLEIHLVRLLPVSSFLFELTVWVKYVFVMTLVINDLCVRFMNTIIVPL